jgi:hypothetical protein
VVSAAAPAMSVESVRNGFNDVAQPVQQVHPSQSNTSTDNTNNQDNHLDFEMLELSSTYETLSESNNRAYQNGYAAGHEEGYQ